ncbi:MAG: DUF2807 domain-containing protein [Bacteroidetes bacterium]|nr:DUF2807 domain-containing protein [Bacteroidota bacterium]
MEKASTPKGQTRFLKEFLSVFIVMSCWACGPRTLKGSGEIVTQTRAVGSNISALEIDAPVNAVIHVISGRSPEISLSGNKNLVDEIKVETEDGTVKIKSKHLVNFDKEVQADITVGTLDDLELEGISDVRIEGQINTPKFEVKVSGAGDVVINDILTPQFEGKISGAGNLQILQGKIANAKYKLSGAGNIIADQVESENVEAKISGAGSIKIFVTQTLQAKLSGAGSIQYKGSPKVDSETSGIGSIERMK